MMTDQPAVQRDERTVAVENAGYRWAYILLTYALLVDVIYRGWFHQEAAWDLLGLVIAGGLVGAFYQVCQKTLTEGWIKKVFLVACLGAVVAAVAAAIVVLLRIP